MVGTPPQVLMVVTFKSLVDLLTPAMEELSLFQVVKVRLQAEMFPFGLHLAAREVQVEVYAWRVDRLAPGIAGALFLQPATPGILVVTSISLWVLALTDMVAQRPCGLAAPLVLVIKAGKSKSPQAPENHPLVGSEATFQFLLAKGMAT